MIHHAREEPFDDVHLGDSSRDRLRAAAGCLVSDEGGTVVRTWH